MITRTDEIHIIFRIKNDEHTNEKHNNNNKQEKTTKKRQHEKDNES